MNLHESLGAAAECGERHYAATALAEDLDLTLLRIGRRRIARKAGIATAAAVVTGLLALAGVSLVNVDDAMPGVTETAPIPDGASAWEDCDPSAAEQGAYGALPGSALCVLWDGKTVLRADAAVALGELNDRYVAEFGRDICLTAGYLTGDALVALADGEHRSADPGVGDSKHGWGIAVDLCPLADDSYDIVFLTNWGADEVGWLNTHPYGTPESPMGHWEWVEYPGDDPAFISIEIRRGATLWQIQDELTEVLGSDGGADPYEYADGVLDQLNAEYDGAFGDSLEGWIAPGTYPAEWSLNADTWHYRAAEARYEELLAMGIAPEDMYDVLTIASIIEGENVRPEDFAGVSAVIHNRLEIGMALEVDSTIHYWTDRHGISTDGVFTAHEHRQIDHPYNTYLYEGLPFGPIGSPSTEAIEAALNPSDTNDLFFVVINLDTREVRFAETFDVHLANVDLLRQWIQENPDSD